MELPKHPFSPGFASLCFDLSYYNAKFRPFHHSKDLVGTSQAGPLYNSCLPETPFLLRFSLYLVLQLLYEVAKS